MANVNIALQDQQTLQNLTKQQISNDSLQATNLGHLEFRQGLSFNITNAMSIHHLIYVIVSCQNR